jgi:hypothetical protein
VDVTKMASFPVPMLSVPVAVLRYRKRPILLRDLDTGKYVPLFDAPLGMMGVLAVETGPGEYEEGPLVVVRVDPLSLLTEADGLEAGDYEEERKL